MLNESMKHKIFLGLGSNVGERQAYLEAALAALPPAVVVLRRSPIYETKPWGFAEQGKFLNLLVEAETELAPLELLGTLKAIERQVGRKPTFRNGPREIDIDILIYGDTVFADNGLRIPHPSLPERAFVLVPLADMVPDLRLPGLDKSVSELLAGIDKSGVKLFEEHKQA